VIVPHFKKNDYFTGISEGIDAIISAIAGEYTAEPDDDSDNKGSSVISTILMIIFGLIMFFLRGRRRGIGSAILLGGLAGGFKGRSSGGFGGFSGGGFSGERFIRGRFSGSSNSQSKSAEQI
jgi:uncharacterized protein